MSTPIDPRREMCAYESLWLGPGAWFANIAALFKENSYRLPSELVPDAEIERVHIALRNLLAEKLDQISIRVHGAGEYPARLRDADHPIEVLYYSGDWQLTDTSCVAVVGTRNPSEEGVRNARRIAHALVREGYTVMSGLAQGIDTAAHNEALSLGGRTVAVIGTPLTEVYPKENAELQAVISRDHLTISQVPFLRYKAQNFRTNRLFFPARNVTMSALTKATIIVEAGNTSGTLVQARAAINQGRKLFILDSCFRNPSLSWPAKYESLGAIRVKNVAQIVESLKEGEADSNDSTDSN